MYCIINYQPFNFGTKSRYYALSTEFINIHLRLFTLIDGYLRHTEK